MPLKGSGLARKLVFAFGATVAIVVGLGVEGEDGFEGGCGVVNLVGGKRGLVSITCGWVI